jgi:hypothetical protein
MNKPRAFGIVTKPAAQEGAVVEFLNSDLVLRWAETRVGLYEPLSRRLRRTRAATTTRPKPQAHW